MAGTRAAVAAAIVSAEKDHSGAAGAMAKLAAVNVKIDGTPFAAFVASYFTT